MTAYSAARSKWLITEFASALAAKQRVKLLRASHVKAATEAFDHWMDAGMRLLSVSRAASVSGTSAQGIQSPYLSGHRPAHDHCRIQRQQSFCHDRWRGFLRQDGQGQLCAVPSAKSFDWRMRSGKAHTLKRLNDASFALVLLVLSQIAQLAWSVRFDPRTLQACSLSSCEPEGFCRQASANAHDRNPTPHLAQHQSFPDRVQTKRRPCCSAPSSSYFRSGLFPGESPTRNRSVS